MDLDRLSRSGIRMPRLRSAYTTACAKQVRAAIEDFVLRRFEFPDSTLQARKRHDRLAGE
jgi:hypothetical protein